MVEKKKKKWASTADLGEKLDKAIAPISRALQTPAAPTQEERRIQQERLLQEQAQKEEEKRRSMPVPTVEVKPTTQGQTYRVDNTPVTQEEFKQQKRASEEEVRIIEEGGRNVLSPEEQAQRQALLAQLGQLGDIGLPQEQAPINWSQALTEGTVGNLGSLLRSGATGAAALGLFASTASGAKVGAALGAPGGGAGIAIGATVGAVVGAIATIYSGVVSNVKAQQAGEIGAAKDELTASKANMLKLQRLAAIAPQNAQEIIDLYNHQLVRAHKARQQVKLETQGDLNAWMEDGRDILTDFDTFLEPGGQAYIYGQRIRFVLDNQDLPIEYKLALLEQENA